MRLCWKDFGEVVKTEFCVSIGTLWRKKCFFWKEFRFYLFQKLSRKFQLFVQNFRLRCQNGILVSMGKIWRKLFFSNGFYFFTIPWQLIFDLKKIKGFIFSRRWAKLFRTFRRKTSVVVVKTALYLSIGTIWQFFWGNSFFLSFRDNERFFLTFCWKDSARLWKLHSACPLKRSEEKQVFFRKQYTSFIFLGFWAKNFRFFVELFRWVFENCFLRVHRTKSTTSTFFQKNICFSHIIFGYWAKRFWPFVENHWPG